MIVRIVVNSIFYDTNTKNFTATATFLNEDDRVFLFEQTSDGIHLHHSKAIENAVLTGLRKISPKTDS